MTSGLRKAHKYIWLVIAIAVPSLIFLSIKDLKFSSVESDSVKVVEIAETTIFKTSENDLVKASLVVKDSTKIIELILKSTLKNPSSIVFGLNENDEKGNLIGQLTASGIYHFDVREWPKGILIFDALKNKLITKLEF